MLIYICSPYGGKEENYRYAVERCRAVAAQGHTPIASHVMLHGILDDEAGRERGVNAGLYLLTLCDEIWVYGHPTVGMRSEINLAAMLGKIIRRFAVDCTKETPHDTGQFV